MRNKNQNVYTVGQVNSYIKNIFDQDYMLRRIYVSGEVSTVNTIRPATSIFP